MRAVTQSGRAPGRIVLWVSVAGLMGSIVWGLFGYSGLVGRLDALARTAVPGQVSVEVAEPETLTVFYEDPTEGGAFVVQTNQSNTLSVSPVDLRVIGPSGEPIATPPYARDLRFHHEDRIVTALATIDIEDPGTYTVEVSGDVPSASRVSVGDVIDRGLVAGAAGMIALLLVSLIGVVVGVVLTSLRRDRMASPDTRAEAPLERV